jgi:hypothetical protein
LFQLTESPLQAHLARLRLRLDAVTIPTGLSATGSVGSVTTQTSNIFPVTGVSATGAVGDISFVGNVVVEPSGISAQGKVGQVLVWARLFQIKTQIGKISKKVKHRIGQPLIPIKHLIGKR